VKTKLNNETPKFYETDGALRAWSNRSLVLAGVMGLVALIAVAGFLFIRMEPPTVIRIGANGQASVVSPIQRPKSRILPALFADKPSAVAADDYEREAFITDFLNRYLSYDSYTLSQNWADALNRMTENLRRQALADLEKNDTVGKLEQAQASSTLTLSHIEQSKTEPLVYTAFGVRTVRTVTSQQESIDQLVEEYHVRLVNVDRSAQNPSGLLVGEYWSKQIEGEKRDAVLTGDPLSETGQAGGSHQR
jgi:hypothetical protein